MIWWFPYRITGIGISETDQQQIFDKFQQVVDSKRGRPPGTGLGLSITRQIIEHHNGKLGVRSSPGKGSTFYFSLPFAPENKKPQAQEETA